MIEVPLTQGRVALIDDEDAERVLQFKWCLAKTGKGRHAEYAQRNAGVINGKKTWVKLHRFILNAPKGSQIDHINGNGLDNRRCNLRYATNAQNHWNTRIIGRPATSGFRGVTYIKRKSQNTKPFAAHIKHFGKMVHIGYFKTAEEAARAFDVKAKELRGEFAILNFPD